MLIDGFLDDDIVERQLGDGLHKSVVLALEFFEALRLVELEPAVHTPPIVIDLLRDSDATADFPRGLALPEANLCFAQLCDLLGRSSLPRSVLCSLMELGNNRI